MFKVYYPSNTLIPVSSALGTCILGPRHPLSTPHGTPKHGHFVPRARTQLRNIPCIAISEFGLHPQRRTLQMSPGGVTHNLPLRMYEYKAASLVVLTHQASTARATRVILEW